MLIVCPSCARRYSVDADRIGPEGRSVRCASCREAFFVPPPDDEDNAQAFAPEAGMSPQGGQEEAAATSVNDNGVLEQRRTPRRPVQRPHSTSQKKKSGGFWLGAGLAVMLAVGTGLIVKRDAVAAKMPRLAMIYDLIHLPANVRGLAFRNVTSEVVDEPGGRLLVVAGEIENITGTTRRVPALSLTVKGREGDPIYTWTAQAPLEELEAGQVQKFRARLASPPPDGQNVLIHFVKTGASGALAATGQGS